MIDKKYSLNMGNPCIIFMEQKYPQKNVIYISNQSNDLKKKSR